MTTLTATTPFGTFTRTTDTVYTHVAVFTAPSGIRLVGAAGIAAARKGLPTTTEYGTVWSRSERNARKAKMGYNSDAVLLGVFPVDQDAAKDEADATLAALIEQAQAPVIDEPTPTMANPEWEPEPVAEPSTDDEILERYADELASQEQLDELNDAQVDKGELLTRQEAASLIGAAGVVKQVGKALTHRIKADRKDPTLARTLCGVPIHGAANNWLWLGDWDLTCKTCVATEAKNAKLAAKAAAKAA